MKVIKKPTDETIQQIDFVIQGLENGRYKELAKEVEFHQKLKGMDAPEYFQSLIFALEAAQNDIMELERKVLLLETDLMTTKQDLTNEQSKTMQHDTDILQLAKAVKYLMAPNPLDKAYDLQEINNWLNTKSIY